MAVVISDSSPLVHLSAIKRFGLLKAIYSQLFVPPAVFREVAIEGRGRPGADDLAEAVNDGWVKVATPTKPLIGVSKVLDAGEAEALALAVELSADMVLIDEAVGRTVAMQLGLRAVGTLGVLIEAKRRDLVPTFREELEKLHRDSEFLISAEIERIALEIAGEA